MFALDKIRTKDFKTFKTKSYYLGVLEFLLSPFYKDLLWFFHSAILADIISIQLASNSLSMSGSNA